MLTDQGAYTHEHFEESWEGPAYDCYYGDSHIIVVDASGVICHTDVIDWDLMKWCDEMASLYSEN